MPRLTPLRIASCSGGVEPIQGWVWTCRKEIFIQSSRGFTLIEMMITVAIISILCCVLMLVTGPVLESAHRTACASNLRQWGVAVMSIAADNRGLLPEMAIASGGSAPVAVCKLKNGMNLSNPLLEEYIGFTGDGAEFRLAPMYRCPSNPSSMNLKHWDGYGWFSMSYAYLGRSDALVSGTVFGQEALCIRRLDAQRLLMQDGLFKWWVGPDSWSFNHAENRASSSNGDAGCWRGQPQLTGQMLPANGINQLWGDGRVAWRTLDRAMRSDVGNTSLWSAVVGYGLEYYYFPRNAIP